MLRSALTGDKRKGDVMSDAMRKILMGLFLAGVCVPVWPVSQFMHPSVRDAWAGAGSSAQSTQVRGDAERGRAIFNGRGVCHYCHGVDGYRDKQPQLEADTAALIAQLNPPPPDLRNPNTLRLTTDRQRAKAIREGHPGTGMFPDTRMSDRDLADMVAYLATLRKKGSGGAVPAEPVER